MDLNPDIIKFLHKAQAICSKAEKCKSDIIKHLQKYELSESDIDSIIKELIEDKFIDDSRYAKFYVNDKLKFNKWGKIKIRYFLKQKQIDDYIINDILQQIDDDFYIEILKTLIKQKLRSIKKSDDEIKKKSAVLRFAISRGFEYGLIMNIINKS
ncbi:MAG: regulatory protein RecX [Bacteroidales bacterium]|nr:regulatory protein RecX [Bacteroidales bacterium]MDD4218225.1 regulatory protein RecX [Bacteroidales bacterium]MDY0143654.1 regulatory protein RecX [Bacteroidales bacterium]